MTIIKFSAKDEGVFQKIDQLAIDWQLAFTKVEDHVYRLMPGFLLGFHGIWCENDKGTWRFWREQDATTWEDFLLMHITHKLAYEFRVLLYYEWGNTEKMVEPEESAFLSFDSYAEYVVRKEEGIMKNIKKNWLYKHQKRYTT